MNKKRLMSMDRFGYRVQVVPTDVNSPFAVQNRHYRFVLPAEQVEDENLDLTQARAVIDYIKGL